MGDITSLFGLKPDTPNTPPPPEEVETITKVEEESEVAKRKKKQALPKGRQTTQFAGIQTLLKKRLGE